MAGYRVRKEPYKVYTAPVYERLYSNYEKQGGSYYDHKDNFYNFDILIYNVFTTP